MLTARARGVQGDLFVVLGFRHTENANSQGTRAGSNQEGPRQVGGGREEGAREKMIPKSDGTSHY